MSLMRSPTPAITPSSSMHSCSIMVESMSAMSRRLRRLCGGNDVGIDRVASGWPRGIPAAAAKAGTSSASPSASQCGAAPPRSRSISTTSRADCAGARGCYEDENGIHDDRHLEETRAAYCRPHRQRQVRARARARAQSGTASSSTPMRCRSMQPLRILSARPTPEEEATVPHRLYGHVAAEQPYSVAAWLAEARARSRRPGSRGCSPS